MITKLYLTLVIFGTSILISNAQQIINNDLQIGQYDNNLHTGYGKRLTLGGIGNSSDDIWLAKFGRGLNKTDLRINIGDDPSNNPDIMDKFSIGVTSPYNSINWKNLLTVTSGGRVGINTDNPEYELDINGKMRLHATENNNGWYTAYLYHIHSLVIGAPAGRYSHNKLELKPTGSDLGQTWSTLEIYRSPKQNEHVRMVSLTAQPGANNYINSGKVGIGTSTPTELLEVAGTIRAREVKVEVNAGADHVFKSDYNLLKLEEVEAFVKENKHLPEIPSEKEMQENGLSVNEFQIKLLQKIEELTLYVIDLEKQVKDLKHHQNK
jgi:hypothetical protein